MLGFAAHYPACVAAGLHVPGRIVGTMKLCPP
jgi:hypothetical protein